MKKDLKNISLGVVGATGLVGKKVLEIIGIKYSFKTILAAASKASKGKMLQVGNATYILDDIESLIEKAPHCVIFACSAAVAKRWAPVFVKKGIRVIDNSSAWRMDKHVKLIVPEVNGSILTKEDFLIANPNCSTIQLVIILKPLHDIWGIQRVVISTYQAVSGGGNKALKQFFAERKSGTDSNNIDKYQQIYPHNIDMNIIPHIDNFTDNGYTKEELKIIYETKKILASDAIKISATAVRVPVGNVHCESINIEFKQHAQKHICIQNITDVLSRAKSVEIVDNINSNLYPMPCNTDGSDLVKVGRIRMDLDSPNSINLWTAADNIRKGAATNALQIVEILKTFIE